MGRSDVCQRCYYELDPVFLSWKKGSYKCLSLYEYKGSSKSLLYQFKGCGDIELNGVFFGYVAPMLSKRYHGYSLVFAPSSKSHDLIRGFNQVEEMSKCLNLPIIDCLRKLGESKQSDLSFAERKEVYKKITWKKGSDVKGKKILLIDDVYTTGSTALACLNLLKNHGAKKVCLLVMSKTPSKNNSSV